MKFLKILKWLTLITYLIFAVIWASFVGFNRAELVPYDGHKLYDNIITDITDSYLTNDGELVLCLAGYLAYSEKYHVELSSFSVKIPIVDIWSKKRYKSDTVTVEAADSIGMYLTDKVILGRCEIQKKSLAKKSLSIHIDRTKIQMHSFDEYKYVENLQLQSDEKFVVVVVSNHPYGLGLYAKSLGLFVVGKEPDIVGRKYYRLRFERTLIYRNINFFEYTWAFVKDALLFPVQLSMFLGQHG